MFLATKTVFIQTADINRYMHGHLKIYLKNYILILILIKVSHHPYCNNQLTTITKKSTNLVFFKIN